MKIIVWIKWVINITKYNRKVNKNEKWEREGEEVKTTENEEKKIISK